VLYSDAAPALLGDVLGLLREALGQVPLARATHSLRIFTCHDHGALDTNEVLLDGEPWDAGQAVVAAAPGPATAERIGARLFALLIPATEAPRGQPR
jgi:hypothetical protein